MPQRIEFEGAVHEFPDDFADEDIAAALGGGSVEPGGTLEPGSAITPYVAPVAAAATYAPAIVSGVNKLAAGAGSALQSRVGQMAPGVMALDAAGDVLRGDVTGAVKSAAMSAATTQLPKVAGVIQEATKPAVQRMVRFAGQLLPVERLAAGPVMRGAQAVSRVAGPAAGPAVAMSTAYDIQQALIARANDPSTSPTERESLLRLITRATGGSRSR